MKKLKLTEEQFKKFNEAMETPCQTPDVMFNIHIEEKKISIELDLPNELDLDEDSAKLLEANIHNALEMVLAQYFK